MRRESFSSCTEGTSSPPVWKDTHDPRSELNSSVKKSGTGEGIALAVGTGVKVIVAVAGGGRVGDAVIGMGKSA